MWHFCSNSQCLDQYFTVTLDHACIVRYIHLLIVHLRHFARPVTLVEVIIKDCSSISWQCSTRLPDTDTCVHVVSVLISRLYLWLPVLYAYRFIHRRLVMFRSENHTHNFQYSRWLIPVASTVNRNSVGIVSYWNYGKHQSKIVCIGLCTVCDRNFVCHIIVILSAKY